MSRCKSIRWLLLLLLVAVIKEQYPMCRPFKHDCYKELQAHSNHILIAHFLGQYQYLMQQLTLYQTCT